jgi:hypothetical protein
MGNSSSSSSEQHPGDPGAAVAAVGGFEEDPFDGVDTLGYRVLGVQPDSPAAMAGLVSFLDFLIGVDEKMLLGSGEHLEPGEEYDDVDLPAFLEEKKGQVVEFLVWNIKSQTARLVQLTPSDTWGGAGLLGVTIRLDNYAGAEDRLVRVLSVEPNPSAPANIAGLVPEHDYLLGTTHHTLDSVDSLARLLHQRIDQILELYVYNDQTDVVRVVALVPTHNWNGRGILGAEVATGYLHRLPSAARSTAGTSVQRKVRYKPGTMHENGTQQPPVLELEPQLEMEIVSDEDDEVESVALQEENHRPKTPNRSQETPNKQDGQLKELPYETQLHSTIATTPNRNTNITTPQRGETTQTQQQQQQQLLPRESSSTTASTFVVVESIPSAAVPRPEEVISSTTQSSLETPAAATITTIHTHPPQTFVPSPRQKQIPRAPSSAGLDPIEVRAIFERKPLSGEIAGGSPSQIGDMAPQKHPNPYRAQSLGSGTTATTGNPILDHSVAPVNITTAANIGASVATTTTTNPTFYASSYGTTSYYGGGLQQVPMTYSAPPAVTNPPSHYQSSSSSAYGATTYASNFSMAGQPYNPSPPYSQPASSYSYHAQNPPVLYSQNNSEPSGPLPPAPKQFHYSAST